MTGSSGVPASVSLVTWNAMEWLDACLDSVAAQTLADHELLIVDNASEDGTVARLRERAAQDARIRLSESVDNLGYGRAHNRNIRDARGATVLLLNQDVLLDPTFLEAAHRTLQRDAGIAAVQGLVYQLAPGGRRTTDLDTAGLALGRDRRAQIRRPGPDDPDRAAGGPVWGADGPAPVYRRAALLDVKLPSRESGWEILDEDFFAHKEDVDLAWRLQRRGWSAWYEPAAVAWHERTSVGPSSLSVAAIAEASLAHERFVRQLAWRNQRLMQVKNEELVPFLRDLPWIAARELAEWAFVIVADRGRLGAMPGFFRALPWALRKRRAVMSRSRRTRVSA